MKKRLGKSVKTFLQNV